ncbi:hypothetical protein EXS62_00295 [Candidatus Kaiserbacteria bacterium]|nr:hypothetical protein [Candidatus Kaiserbacteria bacterium]
MTKSTWAVIVVVVLMIGVGLAVVYRAPLSQLFSPGQDATPAHETPPITQAQTYSTSTYAVQYPSEYLLNEEYAYDQFGPKKLIHGISLTIPANVATGTNLSADTRISVEQLPRAKKCTGDIFIPDNVAARTITEGGTDYSLATTSGAAAGNRYEETVFALATSSPCTAVRYFVHYAAIENFPQGAVREFDRTALLNGFDTIRRTLVIKGIAAQ